MYYLNITAQICIINVIFHPFYPKKCRITNAYFFGYVSYHVLDIFGMSFAFLPQEEKGKEEKQKGRKEERIVEQEERRSPIRSTYNLL